MTNGKNGENIKSEQEQISPLWGRLAFALSFVTLTSLIFGGYLYVKKPQTLDMAVAYADSMFEEKPEALAIPAPQKSDSSIFESALNYLPPVPGFTDEEQIELMDPHDALNDPLGRISEEFHIPKRLRKRTQFWFDIYTKHDKYTHVIHHTRYPWIVYKVIDTNRFMDGKGAKWQQQKRADTFVANEKRKVIKALRRLARKKSYRGLKGLEKDLYTKLRQLKGKRRSVLRYASRTVRSQLGQKDFFKRGLRVSARYMPYMEEAFTKQGLPVELTRMPFVESSFNTEAQSKVGASGIWQIMPRTGQAHMIVSRTIDERNSPLKATRVAAKLLKSYYHSLKSWPLAVTSYNHGIGNIRTAIRRAKSRELPTIIDRYYQGAFKFASANFYTCFLAALHAERYQDALFKHVTKDRLIERETLKLSKGFRLKTILKHTGLDKETFLIYNLDLNESRHKNPLLPKGFELHLPPGHKLKFFKKIGRNDPKEKRQAADDTLPRSDHRRDI